jgi:hypothetical protein
MITNLLFSVIVALATNVTERLPQHQVPDPVPPSTDGWTHSIYRFHWENDANPSVKWVRTTVIRTRKLQGEFEGAKLEWPLGTETVSDVEVEHKVQRVEAWKPVATNDVCGKIFIGGSWWPSSMDATNGLVLTNWSPMVISNWCITNTFSK